MRRKCHTDRRALPFQRWLHSVLLGALVLACAPATLAQPVPLVSEAARPPKSYTYAIVNTYPHDRGAFTQGLVARDGVLYESTGLNGRSSLRKVELETGTVITKHDLESQHFGEGLTDWGRQLIQITWQTRTGFVYDIDSFKLLRTFEFNGEGWGITHDGKRLILSDGSARLRFLDPRSFAETGFVDVTYQGRPLPQLNELEFIRGEVWANVWGTPHVVMIDPVSGRVKGQVDFSGLLTAADMQPNVDVFNGIAWDAKNDRLFVTGKLWPKLFEVKLKPLGAGS